MAEPVVSNLRRPLIAHEPEPLPLTAVFSKSWRVFFNHWRHLLGTAIATAAIPLLVVLALTAIFGPIIQAPEAQPGGLDPWVPPTLEKHGRHEAFAPEPAEYPHRHRHDDDYDTPPAPDHRRHHDDDYDTPPAPDHRRHHDDDYDTPPAPDHRRHHHDSPPDPETDTPPAPAPHRRHHYSPPAPETDTPPAPAPHRHHHRHHLGPAPAPGPTPQPKINPVSLAVVTAFNFLLSAAAHVALVAVFVYVVLGDHVGRRPGSIWQVIKNSFWRIFATDVAQSVVTLLVTFLLGALVALIGGVVTGLFFKGASPNVAATTTLVIWLIIALPITIFIVTGLALSDQTAAVEGGNTWGFAALRRSWFLSKGNRASILVVVILSALVTILLGSPLEILVNNFQDGGMFANTWWKVLLAILGALAVFLLSVAIQAFLQVLWVELYLSSRKKVEPEFGLSHIERYFEAGGVGAGNEGYSAARQWDDPEQ